MRSSSELLARSTPARCRASRGDRPALPDLPDDVVVGDEHVVEEHLVEQRLTGDLAQRADVHAIGPQVDRDRGDARVLRRLGVGAHRRQPHGRRHRAAGPDLLAVDEPAAVDARRPGGDRGGVRAGVGLAEELAPAHLTLEARWHPAGDLVGRACCTRVSSTHAPMPSSGCSTPSSSSSMTSCSTAPAPRPQGCGQCGTK